MSIDLWEHQNMKIEIFQKIQINIRATCVLFVFCDIMTIALEIKCPEYDSDLEGNTIACINDVVNWNTCGRLCHNMDFPTQCKFWSYSGINSEEKRCCMKSSNDGLLNNDGFQSGDSECFW